MPRRVIVSLVLVTVSMSLAAPASSAGPAGPPSPTAPFRFLLQHGYMVGDVANFDAWKARQARRFGVSPAGAEGPARAAATKPKMAIGFKGMTDTSGDPPDTTGAIGPKSYIEAVNSEMGVFSKRGKLLGSHSFTETLGACQTSAVTCEYSDPQVLWDPQTQRFYYEDLNADIGGTDNWFMWGFSKTSHPTTYDSTQWCNYKADFGYGATLPDYPKMGQTNQFLVIGVNAYDGDAYVGSDIDTIQKPQGSAPVTTCPDQSSFTLKRASAVPDCNPQGQFAANLNPAQQSQPSRTGWIVGDPDPTNSGFAANWIDLIKVTPSSTPGEPTISVPKCVSVPTYEPPPPAPQKVSPPIPAYTIDTLDARLTHAVSAVDPRIKTKGHLAVWTSHTVAGGAGSELDWYEIDPVKATAFQKGVVSDPALFVFNGAIASDRHYTGKGTGKYGSDAVIGFSTSGTGAFPAIEMVSKRGSGAQSAFVVVHASPGPDAGFSCSENPVFPGKCRWGDYAGASPDLFAPTTGKTGRVWLDNEWVTGKDGTTTGLPTWMTWIWRAVP